MSVQPITRVLVSCYLAAGAWLAGAASAGIGASAAAVSAPAAPAPATGSVSPVLENTENILILGSDQRPDDPTWRTDTIMVAAIDWQRNQVGLLSIPRDLYVDLPGIGKDRINTADELGEQRKYPGGGLGMLKTVISDTLGIRTDHYARIKMDAFGQIIDTLGGITITLDSPLHELDPWGEPYDLTAGPHFMNGEETLRYVRSRYLSSDLDRGRRQQQVLWAIRDRARQGDWLPRLPAMYQSTLSMVNTDLGFFDVLRLATFAMKLERGDVHGRTFDYSLVQGYTTPGGAQVLLIRDQKAVHAWIAGIFDAPSPGSQAAASPPKSQVEPAQPSWSHFPY